MSTALHRLREQAGGLQAVCQQVWEQAECVRRLRERLTEFPGMAGYQSILAVMREKQPLSNAEACLPRSFEPM